jgi:hypothetical protein
MFENKPLSQKERGKLNNFYLEVIRHYEYITNRPFMKDELVILKLLIEITTPAVIKTMISKFYKDYPENFTTLSYIYPPIKNMFKNKKRSNN